MLHFNARYFLLASGLFGAEILIAVYAHDQIIRPYGGDVLATIFLYCLMRSVVVARPNRALLAALLLSYLIEGLQLVDVLTRLGWQHWRLARIVLGSRFAWGDMLVYTLGALVVLAVESWRARPKTASIARHAPL